MFIGRKNELQFLNDAYFSDKAELIVLYGRRRVGKTELLKEFCKNKTAISYTCRELTDAKQLQSFTDKVHSYKIPAYEYVDCISDWEKVFSCVLHVQTDAKKLLIIDEFPYACKVNESIPSILQVLWDDKLRYENVMIILCGSAMSFIEKELLAEKNPLYGRTTGIYKVKPMPYTDALKFFPDFSVEDKLMAYSMLGGVPHYLAQFSNNLSIEDNVKRNILRKGCSLYNEVEFLLKQELRETSVYNTIVEAIALGNNSFSNLLSKTQLEKSKLSVYLKNLIELSIVEKESPALSSDKDKNNTAKGNYILCDNFFRFWYAFAYRNLTDLENDDIDGVWEDSIQGNLHTFASKPFEKLCLDYLYILNKKKQLPFRIHNASRYWGKTTQLIDGKKQSVNLEIDILAPDKNKQNFIFGECKFTNEQFDMQQLKKLQDKVFVDGKVYFFLFSLSGFTDSVKEYSLSHNNVVLVEAKDIVALSE
ncbi:MAG: ATP-binding protein [Candidatus Coproplasma sp.]